MVEPNKIKPWYTIESGLANCLQGIILQKTFIKDDAHYGWSDIPQDEQLATRDYSLVRLRQLRCILVTGNNGSGCEPCIVNLGTNLIKILNFLKV